MFGLGLYSAGIIIEFTSDKDGKRFKDKPENRASRMVVDSGLGLRILIMVSSRCGELSRRYRLPAYREAQL